MGGGEPEEGEVVRRETAFFFDLAEQFFRVDLSQVGDDVRPCRFCVWARVELEEFLDVYCYIDEASVFDYFSVRLVPRAEV